MGTHSARSHGRGSSTRRGVSPGDPRARWFWRRRPSCGSVHTSRGAVPVRRPNEASFPADKWSICRDLKRVRLGYRRPNGRPAAWPAGRRYPLSSHWPKCLRMSKPRLVESKHLIISDAKIQATISKRLMAVINTPSRFIFARSWLKAGQESDDRCCLNWVLYRTTSRDGDGVAHHVLSYRPTRLTLLLIWTWKLSLILFTVVSRHVNGRQRLWLTSSAPLTLWRYRNVHAVVVVIYDHGRWRRQTLSHHYAKHH